MSVPTVNLVGGHKMPIIGFGTAGKPDGLEPALNFALEQGYRHIDTAYDYRNEEIVGKVLQEWISSGKVKREELFVVTKLPRSANSPDKVEEYLKESLKKLQLDYVDLYLIHFPVWIERIDPKNFGGPMITHPTDHVALWKKFEEQVDAGRAKTIGVSNFNARQISKILNIARIKPASLQVEVHAYFQNDELVKYAQEHGIAVVAYSPLGAPGNTTYSLESGLSRTEIEDPNVLKIASKHNKTPNQILLKYLIQRNIVVIPKSNNPTRITENLKLFDFSLDDQDLKVLRSLDAGERARIGTQKPNPESLNKHPEWPFSSEGPSYAIRKPLPAKPSK